MNVIYCNDFVLLFFFLTGKEIETQRSEITCHVLSWGVAELRYKSRPSALVQGQQPRVPMGQEALEPGDASRIAAGTAAAWAARPRCPQRCSGIDIVCRPSQVVPIKGYSLCIHESQYARFIRARCHSWPRWGTQTNPTRFVCQALSIHKTAPSQNMSWEKKKNLKLVAQFWV